MGVGGVIPSTVEGTGASETGDRGAGTGAFRRRSAPGPGTGL